MNYKICFNGPMLYTDGDIIAINYYNDTLKVKAWHYYTMGSVVGDAIEYCKCPFEEVERWTKRGAELHYATPHGTSISSGYGAELNAFYQELGDKIKFHGKIFKIVPARNNNIKLEMKG